MVLARPPAMTDTTRFRFRVAAIVLAFAGVVLVGDWLVGLIR